MSDAETAEEEETSSAERRFRYISTEEGKASGIKRDGEILIHRKKPNGSVHYRITDDPSRLSQQDW